MRILIIFAKSFAGFFDLIIVLFDFKSICGVIITDHQVQNLFAIVDRAYVIGEHTIIAEGKPKDILKSTKARELYFGSLEN